MKKKLLILGGNYVEIDLVKRAKELGVYTIVTDNHANVEDSPAKEIADEKWFISWSDLDTLEKMCIRNKVDGIIAGFSEFRVEQLIKLCGRLGKPCYLNMPQLDITRDKIKFKELCRKYGIPTVKEFRRDERKIYPVIIKPVDRAGSIGINVATNDEEFEKYYAAAEQLSPSKKVIIEEFIEKGVKFDIYYYVQDGVPYFIGSSDTCMCKKKEHAKILQKAWLFPSKFENQYLQQHETSIVEMLKGIGISNSYLTMSAFYKGGKFYFFEAGFRLSGEMSYNWCKEQYGFNYLDCVINYALGMPQPKISVVTRNKISVILNLFGTDGKVTKISDSVLSQIPQLNAYNLHIKENDEISNSTDILKKIAMLTLTSKHKEDLTNAIDIINQSYDILDENHSSLIYERFSSNELLEYYDIKTI